VNVTVATPSNLPPAYEKHIVESKANLVRAEGRLERAIATTSTNIDALDPARMAGIVDAANQALFSLAAADRTRGRLPAGEVPRSATRYAQEAARGIEMGTRAVRRAAVLLAQPDIGADPEAVDAVVGALNLGQSHFRTSEWLLGRMVDKTDTTPRPEAPKG
jgi:hypothetical protein